MMSIHLLKDRMKTEVSSRSCVSSFKQNESKYDFGDHIFSYTRYLDPTTVLDPPKSVDSKISSSNVASTSGEFYNIDVPNLVLEKTCPKEGTQNHVNSCSEGSDENGG